MGKTKKRNPKPDPDVRGSVQVPYELKLVDCVVCGIRFGLPSSFYNLAVKQLAKSFFCPVGHAMHNIVAQNRLDRERREVERKKRKAEEKERQNNPGLLKRILSYRVW